MKKLSLYILLVLAGLMFVGTTDASPKKGKKILWAVEDIKWEAMKDGPPGVMTATLWGDPAKGAYAGFNKFPAGFKAPLHFHTNETKIVIIKGAYTYEGREYGPGSCLLIPGGDKHVSGGVADSETIFFIEQPGKFDIIPVDAEKK